MKAYRLLGLNIMVLCASIFLSIFALGFVATNAQASYKVEQERIVGAIQAGGIVGGVDEGTPALRTGSNGSANNLIAKGKIKERIRKWKQRKGVVVTPTPTPAPAPAPTPTPGPFDPCGPGQPGYGCWDY